MTKAAASPGRASRAQLKTMPMPQRSHTRRRGSARPGGSSLGRPQRLQNRIGLGRSVPVAVHDLSIRMRAVTVAIRTRKRARRPSRTECAEVQSLRLHEPWPVLGGRDAAAMRAAVAPTSTRRLAGAAGLGYVLGASIENMEILEAPTLGTPAAAIRAFY